MEFGRKDAHGWRSAALEIYTFECLEWKGGGRGGTGEERTGQVFHTLGTDLVVIQLKIRHAAVLMLERTRQVFHTLVTNVVVIQVEIRHTAVLMLERADQVFHSLGTG